jgi:squalene-hopene/tetraprenyl-beta-curcumene cyclase
MMLELLSPRAGEPNSAAIARAGAFLRSSQRGDGRWTCPAGGRFIDSTTWAVRGMIAAGTLPSEPAVDAGLNWLLIHQQSSGGWSEPSTRPTVETESNPDESTAVQTAAVVLALVAAGLADHEATRRGIEFLVDQQHDDGDWTNSQSAEDNSSDSRTTRNDLNSTAWSLMALARWAVAIGVQAHDNQPTGLRLVCSDAF